MNKNFINKSLLTVFLILIVFLSYSNLLDELAEDYTEAGVERSLIVFAISRSLNGVISVAQGTEVALSPAGVGLTFAPGQILDPVNDLIERFSWVVMVSGASLGVQRLFLEITSSLLISVMLSIFIILLLLKIWGVFNRAEYKLLSLSFLKKGLVILMFIRFSVPTIALINEGLYLHYLQPQYTEAQEQLVNASDQIKSINETTRGNIDDSSNDLIGQVGVWLDQTRQSLDVEKQIQSLKQAASDMSHQVINLIVVFVVQTIIFPLLFLWLLIQSAKGIIRSFSI
ncbi:MAG: hypothetical protein DIZ80_17165 [endosymbiont of Galathealinum brachiosum]|uniref:Uncharacterized protein n=1 Tax=endosymbiont of Galathealinum brachiosum TaxID=2200906 RepID=A0A370D993_9GAMM|nr:MAG: hypothetical protein DIZ80_17165 [endosymbiont of Galathealinum brachiosum]